MRRSSQGKQKEPTANWRAGLSGRIRASFWTVVIVILFIGGALSWRWWISPVATATSPITTNVPLPRTRALIAQKIHSLESYNQAMPQQELLQFFEQHLGRTVQPEALPALAKQVTGDLLPRLWSASHNEDSSDRFIAHLAMAEVIHQRFPQRLLANGDVILFPDDSELRIIVSEPVQDFFRDSGWHWRWMGAYLEGLPEQDTQQLGELDLYAAEELSEFLSVYGVAAFMLAERGLGTDDAAVDAVAIQSACTQMANRTPSTHAMNTLSEVAYREETKQQILASIPKPMFQDVTEQLQFDFVHSPNRALWGRRSELETPVGIAGGGVASADFDGDGYPDLYFAGDDGGRLYRNIDAKRFEDVTAAVGVAGKGESRAGYFIDYDNDGDLDLFITFVWQANRIYRNEGTATPRFTDVTDELGLGGGQEITHGAVWFDMDNDGLLDVYTANFGAWPEGASPTMGRINNNGDPNRLYHHRLEDDRHFFVEVGAELGVDDRGWTHCVGAWDFDQDGYTDLFSLNDFSASLLFRNVQGQRFVEVSRPQHLDAAYNAMNFTLLDLDHSGDPAIYVSEIFKLVHRQRYRRPTEETTIVFGKENLNTLRALVNNKLYRRHRDGFYEDVHNTVLEPADHGWAWDASVMDFENDGDLDLLLLNGTENALPTAPFESRPDHIEQRKFMSHYGRQPNVFYVSQDGYFYDVSKVCPLAYEGSSRGSTFFDYDGDGDLDVAINDYDSPARIFQNNQQTTNNWARFKLVGTRSNRNAVGARIEVRFADQVRYDQVVSGSGFLSQNPMVLHFGIGQASRIDKVIVRWPSGLIQQVEDLEVNQTHELRETGG